MSSDVFQRFVEYEVEARKMRPIAEWLMVERFIPVGFPGDTKSKKDERSYKKHAFQVCSNCKNEAIVDNYGYMDWRFCPDCGAMMRNYRKGPKEI